MPREDERYRNLSPRHPQYCTCVECVEKRLQGKGDGPVARVGGLVGKIAAKAGKIGKDKKRGKSGGAGKARGRSRAVGEPVRKHKADCECATCTLLKSI